MSLADVRARTDQLDDQIVALLAQRQQHVEEAAQHKRDAAAVRAPDRRAQMMTRLRERATQERVDPEVVSAVYTAMMDAFIQRELREHGAQAAR